jgi:hypothetical protein
MRKTQLANTLKASASAGEYVTAENIQNVFVSDLDDLFELAFLLTGDLAKAAYCIEITVRECIHPRWMPKTQLPDWVRNAVIRNGIRIVDEFDGNPVCGVQAQSPFVATQQLRTSPIPESTALAGILDLSDFDRLVYVLCVLEHFSMLDCAMLLGTTRQEVRDAQDRAVAHISATASGWWTFCSGQLSLRMGRVSSGRLKENFLYGTLPN